MSLKGRMVNKYNLNHRIYDALKNNKVDFHKDRVLSRKAVYKTMYGMIPFLEICIYEILICNIVHNRHTTIL